MQVRVSREMTTRPQKCPLDQVATFLSSGHFLKLYHKMFQVLPKTRNHTISNLYREVFQLQAKTPLTHLCLQQGHFLVQVGQREGGPSGDPSPRGEASQRRSQRHDPWGSSIGGQGKGLEQSFLMYPLPIKWQLFVFV